MEKAEKILSYGRVINEGGYDFIPKKYAVKAVEAARLEVAEFLVGMSGVFGHYEFFTKELWRKVDGFKKEDKAEVIAAFLHKELHHKFGFNSCPCGCGWFANLDEEEYNRYIKRYEPIFKAYREWQIKQR